MAGPRTVDGGPEAEDAVVYALGAHGSSVRVRARSNVGIISFRSGAVTGSAGVAITGGDLVTARPVSALLHVPVISLDAGNPLYNGELRTRMHAQEFPLITVALQAWRAFDVGRFSVEGDVTIHRNTRRLTGTVVLDLQDEGSLIVRGEERIDLRDFAIDMPFPNVLLLKIYPDVQVNFELVLHRQQRRAPTLRDHLTQRRKLSWSR